MKSKNKIILALIIITLIFSVTTLAISLVFNENSSPSDDSGRGKLGFTIEDSQDKQIGSGNVGINIEE